MFTDNTNSNPDHARRTGRSRRSLALAALAGAGVLAAGTITVGAMASAGSADSAATLQAPDASAEAVPADDGPAIDDQAWKAFDACLEEQLGPDMWSKLGAEEIEVDEIDVEDADWSGGVIVDSPDGSADIIDFGEGDATVTIVKNGDEITVTTEGDVTVEELTFDDKDYDDKDSDDKDSDDKAFDDKDSDDMAFDDVELTPEEEAEWAKVDEAFDACDPLLPGGAVAIDAELADDGALIVDETIDELVEAAD